jgi:hypothetical protein
MTQAYVVKARAYLSGAWKKNFNMYKLECLSLTEISTLV